ncbi:hypothetical protein ABFS83_08G145300 [Erythranthe nasuta]
MKFLFMATCFLFVFLLSIWFPGCLSVGSDTISTGQSLLQNQTIISKEGKFELGFFSPGNSPNSYVGIWYKNVALRTVVWVANRNNPMIPSSGNSSYRLEMSNGSLHLYNNLEKVWMSVASGAIEAAILDTGNLVLRNASGIITWQSFDYPTDTWLPGVRIGFRWFSDMESRLVSWRNPEDPSFGDFSLGTERNGGSELFITRNNSKLWRSGILQGGSFASLSSHPTLLNSYNFSYVSNDDSVYVTYNVYNESVVSRLVLGNSGVMQRSVWSEADNEWVIYLSQPSDACETYAMCGPNAICNINSSPVCGCLDRFEPRDVRDWDLADFSKGCVRTRPVQCSTDQGNPGFRRYSGIRLPANPESLEIVRSGVCELVCADNCSCNAYAYGNGGGCLLFIGDMVDLVKLAIGSSGGDLYVRMDSTALAPVKEGKRNVLTLILAVTIPAAVLVSCFCLCYLRCRKLKKKGRIFVGCSVVEKNSYNELPIFSFSSISAATNDFSVTDKIGEGGFGPGELLNGQFVAVKRLSRKSGQGLEEFRNETELIAKLQHRNLVGILGCCVENDEKILVYEYMPNKSLDFFLFEPSKKEVLDWKRRVRIIEGIAQGLLYLHHYSRLRIVHRDLKASNILLDDEMNPKISDFGMARIFGGNELQANTERIVGTYGYMSPEYAMEGLFSVKSDVFAFGVLMLEIISGQKNTGFYGSAYLSLLGYAWNLWENERGLELVDPVIEIPSCAPLRYIQIGLLCVQESPADRPLMSDIVAMLNNEGTELAPPQHPAFTVGRTLVKASPGGEGKDGTCSANGFTTSTDTISVNRKLRDSETLISNGGKFKLGFFSPENSRYRYVGVMFNLPVTTVIWVANRETPLNDSSGTIQISVDGNLVILDGIKGVIWSSNSSSSSSSSTAVLLDTGNLVLRDSNSSSYLWESFNHASDSFVANLEIFTDSNKNVTNKLTSWRSASDPGPGNFTLAVNPVGIPECFVWKNGVVPHWRTGPWNGQVFVGIQTMSSVHKHGLDIVNSVSGTAYLSFTLSNSSLLVYYVMNSTGAWSTADTECDAYGKCGPFARCNNRDRPICTCFPGFEPKLLEEEWKMGNWTGNSTDGFLKMDSVKLPDRGIWYPTSDDCRGLCLINCSCIAYAYTAGIGCMIWTEDLIDVQKFAKGVTDLYIRLGYSELGNKKDQKAIIATTLVLGSIAVVVCSYFLWKLLLKYRDEGYSRESVLNHNLEELALFKFQLLLNATDQFDSNNMLGEGGFGPVYKGKLPNGQEIAVKRLARSSNQGLEELMNEVEVISKLQHRNLVKLIGCCVECEEKMLVYEYLPNGSLDAYLFDSRNEGFLDWKTRAMIIEGICRGLLYLHRDSRLTIIHRDLKASNILLDDELNPKISDFGMARIFRLKENQANTRRVVGTYGYMSPEYALHGIFSEKSDVYSFGVLLLEILSGKRNTSFYHEEQHLIEYVWKLWNEEKMVNLIDPTINGSGILESDIVRYANVGLLCVQDVAADRPNISTVLSMLGSEILELPCPKQPAFFGTQRSSETEYSRGNLSKCSRNEMSVTTVEGR